jgi:broad specificity phosphatase PhoE
MDENLPQIYLARHGETAWSVSGQHTGLTDIPLTPRGQENARQLGTRLQDIEFRQVFTSPLLRARQTCELAGFGGIAEADPNLVEWNYGQYEGRRGEDIRRQRPGWDLFHDGCPGGESLDDVVARADRTVFRLRAYPTGNVLVFAHMHFLRVIAARWIGLPGGAARRLFLTTASLSVLGYEHALSAPVIRLWNDDRHVVAIPHSNPCGFTATMG